MPTSIRNDADPRLSDFPGHLETFFETIAEEVLRNYGRNMQPQTMEANRGYMRTGRLHNRGDHGAQVKRPM